ncbi:hypothetical protein [Rhodococcus sp. ACT016]|uniref:hypothetical protein n=1 Tax=Rhodococcus sp. ACT016 TaxID=3134808 RepID=UPI003D2B7999
MSVVATPSVHALLRDLVANSPRRGFLHDIEGIELSNQAALVREVVTTVQACLEPDLRALRESDDYFMPADPDRAAGPGIRVIASIAQYDEILRTLLDAAPLIETGRMSTAWTLLGSATDRLRVLTALESPDGEHVARQLTESSARARARFTAAADDAEFLLPAGLATMPIPVAPAPTPAIASLIELIDLGAATGRDGGAVNELATLGTSPGTDYDHLAMVGGHQLHLVLEIIRAATDSLCAVAAPTTAADVWAEWADDVRAAVEFAWDCV